MRTEKLKEVLEKNGLDAFILSKEPNIYYFTGSISGGLLIIPVNDTPVLFTSFLNYNIACDQAKGTNVESYKRSELIEKIKEKSDELKLKKIGFDEISLVTYNKINKKVEAELIQSTDLVWSMRQIKDKKELHYMKKAARQADIGMLAALDKMDTGVTEYELAAEASYAMRLKGADDYAFPFIVASGPRSAYPHAGVTGRKVKDGDLITIDMGARYQGYCIDITRTFIMGKPTKKQEKIYNAVYNANISSFPHYRNGNQGIEIDKISRTIIEKSGYGEYYIHGLGHGIGLEVHEPPSISQSSKDILVSGNVVSNEPGVYLHGYGGVRIEDSVLVTDKDPKFLTKFPKTIEEITL